MMSSIYNWNIAKKAQRSQGTEYSDSFNTFSQKQKLLQAMKSWSNFSLVLFDQSILQL